MQRYIPSLVGKFAQTDLEAGHMMSIDDVEMKDKKTLLVVGCGGHARFILGLVNNSSFKAAGLIDLDDNFDESNRIMGVSVVGCAYPLLLKNINLVNVTLF